MTRLPAEGRTAPAPVWPLARPKKAELELWASLWTTPQSVAWEKLGHDRTVARYVRILVLAEKTDASASILGEARQLEDRLGLSPMAMLRLRWEIVEDEVAEKREAAPQRRLKAVDPSGGQTDAVERS